MHNKYKFVVTTKALIFQDGKFLVLRRSKDKSTFPLFWDLPGGKLEHGDSPDKGMIREISEETNLEVNNLVLKTSTKFLRGKDEAICLIYTCQKADSMVLLSLEHTEHKWITLTELDHLQMQPWLKSYVIHQRNLLFPTI